MTFVAGNTQSFADNGFDFDGTSLKGTYYYCVTSVSFWDHESEASEIIQIDYEKNWNIYCYCSMHPVLHIFAKEPLDRNQIDVG